MNYLVGTPLFDDDLKNEDASVSSQIDLINQEAFFKEPHYHYVKFIVGRVEDALIVKVWAGNELHANVAERMGVDQNSFVGAGKLVTLLGQSLLPLWNSSSCLEKFGRCKPNENSKEILEKVALAVAQRIGRRIREDFSE